MQYLEAVAEFRRLDDTIEAGQWRQAQIAWEAFQAGVPFRQFARDVGQHHSHIIRIGHVWEKHGESAHRPEFASAYRMEEAGADTPEEATTFKDTNRASSSLGKLPPQSRARIIREHLADKETARSVFHDPDADPAAIRDARMHTGNAITDYDRQLHERVTEERHEETRASGRTDQEAMYEVASMMQVLADVVVTGGKLARKLTDGATLSPKTRQSLAGYATKAKATIEWLEGIEDEQHVDEVDAVLRAWAAES